jgi:hypothetical protein
LLLLQQQQQKRLGATRAFLRYQVLMDLLQATEPTSDEATAAFRALLRAELGRLITYCRPITFRVIEGGRSDSD